MSSQSGQPVMQFRLAPRAAASSSVRPDPQPTSSTCVPRPTRPASSTASNSGRLYADLHDGVARPDGTVLLLHTAVMADSDEQALGLLAAFQGCPLAGRVLGHGQDRTSVAEENLAQTAQNAENYRYAVDCTWTDAAADVLAPMLQALWSELDTEHAFSISGQSATRPAASRRT